MPHFCSALWHRRLSSIQQERTAFSERAACSEGTPAALALSLVCFTRDMVKQFLVNITPQHGIASPQLNLWKLRSKDMKNLLWALADMVRIICKYFRMSAVSAGWRSR